MGEENKANQEGEDKNKKKKTKTINDKVTKINPNISIGKIGKLNTGTGKIEEYDLEDLAPEELENFESMLEKIVKGISKESENTNPERYKDSRDSPSKTTDKKEALLMEKAQQDLAMNSHQVAKHRLFTLFDVITNTKELLIQRIGDSGKSDLQHNVADTTKRAANNVINVCLKQVYLWVEKNDINGLKANFKPTNPDDIINKDLFEKKDE